MRQILFICIMLAGGMSLPALDSLEINSQLTEVTVFRSGAQLSRTARGQLPTGQSILVFPGLSHRLDPESIQFRGTGDFTILSVGAQADYQRLPEVEDEVAELTSRRDTLHDRMEELQLSLQLGQEELAILTQNRNFRGSEANLDPEVLRANTEFHRQRLTAIRREALSINRRLLALQEEQNRLQGRIRQLDGEGGRHTQRILVKIDNRRAQAAEFSFSYLAAGAAWLPSYDLRVTEVDQPIELVYRAKVAQQTGEDWTDVKLTFSTGDPSRSAVAPQLRPWRLYRYRPTADVAGLRQESAERFNTGVRTVTGVITDETGEPLIGATVLVEGTSLGTVTDLYGRYELEVPEGSRHLIVSYTGYSSQQLALRGDRVDARLDDSEVMLDEVVVTGAGRGPRNRPRRNQSESAPPPPADPVRVQSRRRATTVVFEVALPYTIPSGPETETVELTRHQVPATYRYLAVPKLDARAYLQAAITDWAQYDLLSGETQLFFEGTYLGGGYLDVDNLADTLQLSLGADESIIIERERIEDFSRGQFIGSRRVASRGWTITARNTKARAINLTVVDQVPISGDSQIDIKAELPEQVRQREDSGIFSWEIQLPADGQEALTFSYEVKHPRDMRVVLE